MTLRDHVREQISLAFSSVPCGRLIAGELAEELDEIGYMRGNIDDIAERLGVKKAEVERVLFRVCQGLTRRQDCLLAIWQECLGLQLMERGRLDPAMSAMISNLDLIARRDVATLKRLCGASSEDILEMMTEIRPLDPRPGTAFTVGVAEAVVADVPAPRQRWQLAGGAEPTRCPGFWSQCLFRQSAGAGTRPVGA